MSDHIVKSFDDELAHLKTRLVQMGGMTENALDQATLALSTCDTELADKIIAEDDKIDAIQLEVEDRAITLIARRQPMALDLRAIIVAIHVSSDLERVGDLAKNIAKRTHAVNETPPKRIMAGYARMGLLALEQLKSVIDAYVQGNAEKALAVWRSDEDLDGLYNSIFRELLTYMMEDPRMIGLCIHLLFCAKNIERIGDHTTNIAENIYFLVHGKPITESRPKRDLTSSMPIDNLVK
jgi:phosphate transport system protein